ncbi:MAG: 2-hydroxyacid dehydrogenase [Pontiellaceae bacterium]|jgi:D-lactate dehydrogenase|nr:2-hydroxyacid dehydrogenase [Pontiellaceae bacterium]
MKRIIFFDAKPYDHEFFDAANRRHGYEIKYIPNRLSADNAPSAAGYDAVCAFVNDDLSAPVAAILHRNNIRIIAMRCAGYNNVDLNSVFGKIHVVRVPAYSPYAVAEHAVALIMALNRKTHKAYNRTRDSNFSLSGLLGFDLHGKTAGIIGTGRIGQVLAGILKGFGMRVLAFDRFPKTDWAAGAGVEYVELDELYCQSDIISLHCPLTPETKYMINEESLSRMKDGVMLINTSRGGLIQTQALIDALKNLKIGAAGLDVYEEEDGYFFEDWSGEVLTDDVLARLFTFPNVLVTAHQAFFTREALRNIAETTLANLEAFFQNGRLDNEICYRCTKEACPRKKEGACF